VNHVPLLREKIAREFFAGDFCPVDGRCR